MFGTQQSHTQGYTRAESLQVSTICVAVVLAVLAILDITPAWFLRWGFAALVVGQIAQELSDDDRSFLKSPAFLLSAIAGTMYSAIPAALVFVLRSLDAGDLIPTPHRLVYLGHYAEYCVQAFALIGMALHGTLRLTVTERSVQQGVPFAGAVTTILAALSILLSIGSLIYFRLQVGPPVIGGILSTLNAPLQSFIIVFIVHQWAGRGQRSALAALAIVIALGVLMYNTQSKAAVYIGLSCLLVWLSVRRPSRSTLLTGALIFVAFMSATLAVVQIAKSRDASIYRHNAVDISKGLNSLGYKLVWRQVGTGHCLHNVIETHGDDDFVWRNQLFWLSALVPRVLWPEKENLSLGRDYSFAFCGIPTWAQTTHSSSITLLGQPIVKGGMVGLAVHGTVLIAGLAYLTYAGRRFSGLGTVWLMALLPWWIDFDQHFALYVANLVKFFLLMCMIALPVLMFGRSGRRA